MKHLVTLVVFLSAIVLGHCELEDAEVQEWCPAKCICEVTAREGITANCSKQNYTSIPPHFPKLNSLNFSHNQISEVRNVNFIHENLRHIQNIDLSNNKIQNIEMKSFEHLTQLHYLDLSSNKITSVSPESFKKLKKLAILDMHGNGIDCIAWKNELPWVNVLCSSSEEYAYDTTMATATLTKASDSNMEIPEGSYTDDTMVTTVTLSTESSNMTERHFDSETVTKTNMNDIVMHITTSTKNYNSTAFGVTQIMQGDAGDQHPSTVPAINEDTSAAKNGIIIGIIVAVLVLIGVCVEGMFIWCCKQRSTNVKRDPEGGLPDESDNEKLLCNSSSFSSVTNN
jgi:hypothetical protein